MRRIGAMYLAVQAVLAIVWWVSLATSDGVREHFELDPARPDVLDAFLIADVIVFVGGSLAGAAALAACRREAPIVVGVVAGGAAYATLYLLGWVALGGDGWVGIPPMVAATVLTAGIAVVAARDER